MWQDRFPSWLGYAGVGGGYTGASIQPTITVQLGKIGFVFSFDSDVITGRKRSTACREQQPPIVTTSAQRNNILLQFSTVACIYACTIRVSHIRTLGQETKRARYAALELAQSWIDPRIALRWVGSVMSPKFLFSVGLVCEKCKSCI